MPLDTWEIGLIADCKADRAKLKARKRVLQALDKPKRKKLYREEVAQLDAKIRELSNESLAVKFETSLFQINNIPEAQ